MTGKWITLITFTIGTVIIWIGLEILWGLTDTSLKENYTAYETAITPSLNQDSIDEIKYKEEEFILVDRDDLE
ncbi:hypothetical protein JW710_04430 [Candidatus Dojkabacteria bacterium]|nr:hypothetical protein [Candidatus Dojkabacteria bacterium]